MISSNFLSASIDITSNHINDTEVLAIDAERKLDDLKKVEFMTHHSLRDAIGLVQQDVYLFDGTIAENIAYGCPGPTRKETLGLRAPIRYPVLKWLHPK